MWVWVCVCVYVCFFFLSGSLISVCSSVGYILLHNSVGCTLIQDTGPFLLLEKLFLKVHIVCLFSISKECFYQFWFHIPCFKVFV